MSVDMSNNSALRPFFAPKGIAVVGARSTPGFGYGISLRLKDDGWGDRTCLVKRLVTGSPYPPTLTVLPNSD